MFGHGSAAVGTGELGHASAISFGLMKRVRELATERGFCSERGVELALGLLGCGLAFGESSLEAGLFGDMRVGGGHGQEVEEREGKQLWKETGKGEEIQLKIALVCEKK